MINRVLAFALIIGLFLPIGVLAQRVDPPGQTGDSPGKSEEAPGHVAEPDHFDRTTVPLRDMADKVPAGRARGGRDFEPGKPLPIGNSNPATEDLLGPQGVGQTDAAIRPLASTTGVPVDPNARVAPPDTTGDLGPNHYVQWVKLRYAVYTLSRDASNNITGFNLVPGFPKNGNTVWQGFGGQCETSNDGERP